MANQATTAARSPSKDQDSAATSYKAGGRASALYAAMGTADVSGQADLATMYVKQLKNQAAQVLGGTIGANLVPIQYNGDLNWSWSDGINVNSLTYNYITGAVGPAPPRLEPIRSAAPAASPTCTSS